MTCSDWFKNKLWAQDVAGGPGHSAPPAFWPRALSLPGAGDVCAAVSAETCLAMNPEGKGTTVREALPNGAGATGTQPCSNLWTFPFNEGTNFLVVFKATWS